MARLFLVRHGEPADEWGSGRDPGLSRFGRSQVDHCAQRLAELGPMKVVSSPLKRAQESAAPAAKLLRQSVTLEPRIGEVQPSAGVTDVKAWMRENFSAISAKKWTDIDPRLQQWREGVLAAVRAINADTAMFTHYVAINVIMGAALQNDATATCRPDFASITEFKVERGDIQLVYLGTPIGEGQPG
jgi:broad specificity phosphatase PhoE